MLRGRQEIKQHKKKVRYTWNGDEEKNREDKKKEAMLDSQ